MRFKGNSIPCLFFLHPPVAEVNTLTPVGRPDQAFLRLHRR